MSINYITKASLIISYIKLKILNLQMFRLQNASLVGLTHFRPVKMKRLLKDDHHIMITNYLSRYRWFYGI